MSTLDLVWEGQLPSEIPANYFITVRMVTAGSSVCLTNATCAQNIQDETAQFITFNRNSSVTSLPNSGIRTTVPTPTPPQNSTIRITATAATVITSLTGTELNLEILTTSYNDSARRPIKQNPHNRRRSKRHRRSPPRRSPRSSILRLPLPSKTKASTIHLVKHFPTYPEPTPFKRRQRTNPGPRGPGFSSIRARRSAQRLH